MEKAGGLMKNEKMVEKGAIKREQAGANSNLDASNNNY